MKPELAFAVLPAKQVFKVILPEINLIFQKKFYSVLCSFSLRPLWFVFIILLQSCFSDIFFFKLKDFAKSAEILFVFFAAFALPSCNGFTNSFSEDP